MGLLSLDFLKYVMYIISMETERRSCMKKIILSVLALLFIIPLGAKDLKVQINSNMQIREFTFLRNYAIVINKDHYYGPISKDVRLKVEAIGGKKLSLSLSYKSGNTYKYTSLGTTSSRVDVVQTLGKNIDFTKTIDPKVKQTSNPIKNFTDSFISSQILKETTPFFKFKFKEGDEVKLQGTIPFWGIPTFYASSTGSKMFYVVENVNLERYLSFVTNCELRKANNIEAYKAQAILARTFALQKTSERIDQYKNHQKTLWTNFQLRPDERDQAYLCKMSVEDLDDYAFPSDDVNNAVKSTQNLVISKNGKLEEIYYCAYCGTCSYCKDNKCSATVGGRGDCQNGLIDYAKTGHNYKQIINHYHPKITIVNYNDLNIYYGYNEADPTQKIENSFLDQENILNSQKLIEQMI